MLIATPGTPGALACLTPEAVPAVLAVLDHGQRMPVAVAAQHGERRILALGHSGYFDDAAMSIGATAAFMQGSLEWAGHKPSAELRVGTLGGPLPKWLAAQGFASCAPLKSGAAHEQDFDVIILTGAELDASARDLIAGVIRSERGPGILVAQTGWGWRQLHHDAPMRENPLNVLFKDAGFVWTDRTVNSERGDRFDAGLSAESPSNFTDALTQLERLDAMTRGKDPAPAALSDDDRALGRRAGDVALLGLDGALQTPALKGRIETLAESRGPAAVISATHPLTRNAGLDRLLLAARRALDDDTREGTIAADPSAAEFPGVVPAEAKPATMHVILPANVKGWLSTGAYAPAGALIAIRRTAPPVDSAPSAEAPAGGKPSKRDARPVTLTAQIGVHTDNLAHLDSWRRSPQIVTRRAFALVPADGAPLVMLASPFGGLVVIDAGDTPLAAPLALEIDNVVEAPRFVLGETTGAQWQHLRTAPAPWAELQTSKVILSVPSASLRDVDDPTAICRTWEAVLDAAADLAARPHDRARPERYVADVQISAGYMHSGYPIMTHLDAAPDMVHEARLRAGTWGLFHELGHNHQQGMWTFEGTGEVTNNLWSLYLMETIAGKPPGQGHDALNDRGKRRARAQQHIETGANFAKWKADPFLALEMYLEIRAEFGWEPFKHVFAEYAALKQGERPETDDQKRDQWLQRISRATGRNLGPFFQKWGVPTSQAARDSVSELPLWMPDWMK
ncbi:hypothetical protein BH11PLA1_BH11PLA1_00330 [soil metagenome]